MKKPNIKRNKWNAKKINDEYWITTSLDSGEGFFRVATVHSADHNSLEDTAQAISSVPDMIDALLAVNHAIENCKGNSGAVYLGDRLEYGIRETLKKAGCTDD